MPELTEEAMRNDLIVAQRARIADLEAQIAAAGQLAHRLQQELREALPLEAALQATPTMLALQRALAERRPVARTARGWLRALK